jgi:diguanylate cyclase (GGDEF)-like protein/PAS domain S-box-containing protein
VRAAHMPATAEHLSVLLVEDDEDDYLITSALLGAQDGMRFDIEWADSYDAARAVIGERMHDVYLIDYRLGARTGLDLVREAFDGEQPAPVILLTGQNDYAVDLEATRLGITDYLLKNQLDASTLERSIRYAVRHHRAMAELRSSQERYALAVRGANDGIWDWDLVASRAYFSPRWKTMLGHTVEEIGESAEDDWFARVHPDDVGRLRGAIGRHLAGRSPHFESEHRIRHATGGYRWVLSRGVAIRDRDGTATRMAGSMSDITDRKDAEQRLLHDALHDALTGLPNRALFMDRVTLALTRAERHPDYRCAILFLDLDRFKLVNDSFSHAVGDQLLIALARRLASSLRPGDTVARLGGDEFTILLDDVGAARDAAEVADRIQRALNEPFRVDGRELFVTASVGISLSESDIRAAELLRNADIAMYDAKHQGKARSAVFDVTMHSRVVGQLQLENDLRTAIDTGTLRVFYQPIVDLGSGRLSGCEALARWPAGDSVVLPEDFIPVAEDTGLIGSLGRYVLDEACARLTDWRRRGVVGLDIPVSVNVSGHQLCEPDLAADVAAALRRHGLPAEALRLEITESTILYDPERMHSALAELRRIGVQSQIDDFGTGYSSLTLLHHFPGDTLKIDRSFVSAMHDDEGSEEIVRAIIALAHNLGMRVIGEGIEDHDQAAKLRALGCEYGQGYLFAEPTDPASFERLTAQWDMRSMALIGADGEPAD